MKLFLTIVKYLVVINLVLFLADELLGMDIDFNLISNVTVPVMCAVTEWVMKEKKAHQITG